MGNEMGNNNITGPQVSEETAQGVDKIVEHTDGPPMLSSTKNNEKDGTEDADMSKSLKDPIMYNGGDEKVVLDQKNSPAKIEDLDEKNMGSPQDDTSTQDDDQNSNLPTERDGPLLKNEAVETTTNSTEISIPVSATTQDMISNKNDSGSDEKIKQTVDVTRERSEENTIGNSSSLLEENIEGSPEDEEEPCRNEVALVGGNLMEEDQIANLEQEHTEASTVEDQFMPMQKETTSSTESISTDYLDADDSEIKEVVTEDEPRVRDSSSYMQPVDGMKLEIPKVYSTEKTEEKEEISEINKTTPVETVTVGGEELKDEKKIHGLENEDNDNPEYTARDDLEIGEDLPKLNSSATSERELEKHEELNEGIATERKLSDFVTAPVEHSDIERTPTVDEGIVDKSVAVQNFADSLEADKEPQTNGIDDLVDIVEVNGKDFTKLDSTLSDHLPIVNEEKVHKTYVNGEGYVAATLIPATVAGALVCDNETVKEIEQQDVTENNAEICLHVDLQVAAKEGEDLFNLPTAAQFSTLQSAQDLDKNGDVKLNGCDIDERFITSMYERKIRNTQESVISSQCDQNQQILPEAPEVVKFESSEVLSSCMRSVECSSATVASGAAESSQEKVTETAEKTIEDQFLLHIPSSGGEAGEETPLLQRADNLSSCSHSTEQSIKVVNDVSVTNISVVEFKLEAEEESEKSPLLSPRVPPEGDFRAPNHSGRNKRPLQSLMTEDRIGTWSTVKEQESLPKNKIVASSPRSRGKQKPRSSLFTSCMCCTTATN